MFDGNKSNISILANMRKQINGIFHIGKKVVKMKKYFASFEGFSKGYNGWVIYYSTLKKSNLGDYIASNGYRTETFFDTLEECINSVSEIRNSGIYNFIELS